MFGRAITPPFYHPTSFITPPYTSCRCLDVLSHPMVFHNPLGPPGSCTLSPGAHKISPPRQNTTPGDNIFKSQDVITGVCYLVSVTVCECVEMGVPVGISWSRRKTQRCSLTVPALLTAATLKNINAKKCNPRYQTPFQLDTRFGAKNTWN